MVKKILLKGLVYCVSFIAVHTINSMCTYGLGQPEEPEYLKRFKKIIE